MSLSSAPIRASLQAVRGCMLRRSCATGGGKWGIGERLKMSAANMLVERFTKSSGFDSAFQGLKIVRLGDGEVTAEMPVTQAITNLSGNLHGGASATLVDILGTMALLTKDATRPGVTVDLNASYPSAAKMGSTLRLEARCGGAELSQSCSSTCRPCSVLKLGRSLAFTEIEIFANDNLVVTGRHTKALPPKK
eukprot:m.163419 g.163419  ORF g.163419 m.163419 type:complete len:193 (-) comp10307_c0_seq16:4769-5347(-)